LTGTYKNLYIRDVADKPVAWLGSARAELRAFPADARRDAGFELRRVQQGLDPDDWKPMASIGPGVREIRIHTGIEHRVFYVATFAEAVYVLPAFEKRTRKTPKRDLDLARERLRALVNRRRSDARTK
jgi:phage-related protein